FFFKILVSRMPEYVMLVLTKDSLEKVKAEALSAQIPPNKIFVSYANREQLPKFLALSSCGIFFIRNSFSKIASSPTKHAELMGMGIPVICNDIGDTGSIIEATGTGMVINDFSEKNMEKYADAISELENLDKGNIRSCAKKYFDLQTGVKKYLSLYNSV